jgi:transposase-like protein
MSQNATRPERDRDLNPRQTQALKHLLVGATIQKAAQSAGVDRSTVHRWLREHWGFQAAYNAAQRDLQREVAGRMLQLAHAACETVAAAVERGDVRAALAVLKGVGALGGTTPEIGGEDPEELAHDATVATQEHAADRSMRALLAAFRGAPVGRKG